MALEYNFNQILNCRYVVAIHNTIKLYNSAVHFIVGGQTIQITLTSPMINK